MKLIADCGATKCDWCLLDGASVVCEYTTKGLNAASANAEAINEVLKESASRTAGDVSEVYFYGAGLVSESACSRMSALLGEHFPGAHIECNSDLLAASRALFGKKKGIVAILGTGSNSCLYDGRGIVRCVKAGGFVLGDEGSANALGQMFLADYIKGFIPAELADTMAGEYLEAFGEELNYENIVRHVYSEGSAARFLASLVPLIAKHRRNRTIAEMIEDNFRSFFERCLLQYDVEENLAGVAGGMGYEFQDVLVRLGNSYGVSFIKFLRRPMEGLISYHV